MFLDHPSFSQETDEGIDNRPSVAKVQEDTDLTEPMDHDRRDLTGTTPFQVDPKITRPQLISAHTKWLFCSGAYWRLKGKCETTQKFVPAGYWFETGRQPTTSKKCSLLTGKGDVQVVNNCSVKKGLRMVLAVVTANYVSCTDGVEEDPRQAPAELASYLSRITLHKANLDGKPVGSFNSLIVITQDGDLDYRLSGDASCKPNDINGAIPDYVGCPLGAVGHYVFLNTNILTKGKHELLLIGEVDGQCSAVKHVFTVV